jgi:hypothetical protein
VSAQQLPAGTDRRWVRLLATRSYDAWLIGWPAGSGLGLHDHGDSSAALCIVRGVLDEQHLPPGGSGRIATRRLVAGDAVAFDAGRVHAVHNASKGDALSVHVYSPPLSTMTFFEHGAGPSLLPVDAALVEHERQRAPLSYMGV